MRLKALKELGYKDIPDAWVKRAADLTPDEQRRFIIADNVAFGDHDWDLLRQNWDVEELTTGEWRPTKWTLGKISEIRTALTFELAEELGIERDYLMVVLKTKQNTKDAIKTKARTLKRGYKKTTCTTPQELTT